MQCNVRWMSEMQSTMLLPPYPNAHWMISPSVSKNPNTESDYNLTWIYHTPTFLPTVWSSRRVIIMVFFILLSATSCSCCGRCPGSRIFRWVHQAVLLLCYRVPTRWLCFLFLLCGGSGVNDFGRFWWRLRTRLCSFIFTLKLIIVLNWIE